MFRLAVVAGVCLGLAACQPLYGAKAEKLHNPTAKPRPVTGPEAVVEVKYIDECNADFRKDPKGVKPDESGANSLVTQAKTSIETGDKAKDKAQTDAYKAGIEKYRDALLKDPYNVEATLQLAVAYDKVWRKGCALQMLHRLVALDGNAKWRTAADAAIDAVAASTTWFKAYRTEAKSAVGK